MKTFFKKRTDVLSAFPKLSPDNFLDYYVRRGELVVETSGEPYIEEMRIPCCCHLSPGLNHLSGSADVTTCPDTQPLICFPLLVQPFYSCQKSLSKIYAWSHHSLFETLGSSLFPVAYNLNFLVWFTKLFRIRTTNHVSISPPMFLSKPTLHSVHTRGVFFLDIPSVPIPFARTVSSAWDDMLTSVSQSHLMLPETLQATYYYYPI